MKRILFTIFALLGVMQAWAYDCKVNGLCYNLNSVLRTATVTYSGYPYNNDYTGHYQSSLRLTGDIEIPSTISYNNVEYTVTAINDYTFYDCGSKIKITSIIIPSTVTTIGKCAFYSTTITSCTIPESVTSVGMDAFPSSWIDNQPNGIVYVGKVAYLYKGTMPNNTTISLKDGTTEIGGYAFLNCGGLTSISIPHSVISIGPGAFANCTSLNAITIPENVTTIGRSAFSGCTGLASMIIPESVTTQGEYNQEIKGETNAVAIPVNG